MKEQVLQAMREAGKPVSAGEVTKVLNADRKDVDMKRLTADAYLQFIVKELKPFIDERYKPLTGREHTFMMGSSMGGLISLYALCEYPQVFGGVGCLSSHLSMAHLSRSMDSPPLFPYIVSV